MFDDIPDVVPDEWVREFASQRVPGGTPVVARRGSPSLADVYYVCSGDGSRVDLLVGPFNSMGDAERWRGPAQDVLLERGEFEHAVTLRVTRLLARPELNRAGDLNAELGL